KQQENVMKAIIRGALYDTSKATKLGSDSSGRSRSDFHYYSETLYKTPRSGRYFLAGSGGPLTRYAIATGQKSWLGGSRIIPLTKEQAFEWAEQALSANEIKKHFGDMMEDA